MNDGDSVGREGLSSPESNLPNNISTREYAYSMPKDDYAPDPNAEPLLSSHGSKKQRNLSVKEPRDQNSKSSSKTGGLHLHMSSESPGIHSNFVEVRSEGRGLSSDNLLRDKYATIGSGASDKSSAYFKASVQMGNERLSKHYRKSMLSESQRY